jgi:hypothetical protein
MIIGGLQSLWTHYKDIRLTALLYDVIRQGVDGSVGEAMKAMSNEQFMELVYERLKEVRK